MTCKIGDKLGVFVGQHHHGEPNGYVRLITADGDLYEGCAMNGQKTGWGRDITREGVSLGWLKNKKSHGNCRMYNMGKLIDQGWFDRGLKEGEFKTDDSEYINWN